MGDDELIDRVNNLEFSAETDISVIDEKLDSIYRSTIDYLICKVEYDKSEENYIRAKDFTESVIYINKENKESVSKRLEDTYLGKSSSYINTLAIGELAEICPDNLPALCLDKEQVSGVPAGFPLYKDWCLNICNDITKGYPENFERFSEEITDFKDWSDDLNYRLGQYMWRSAMAFRFGGKELALKVCDNLPNRDRGGCYERVEKLENLKAESALKCENFRDDLEEVICQL